jgi:hypothetical protein
MGILYIIKIGNFRILGHGADIDTNGTVKSGEFYLEFYNLGYLFLKGMSSSLGNRDYIEGIIIGGTGSLKNLKGTFATNVSGTTYSLTLYFRGTTPRFL